MDKVNDDVVNCEVIEDLLPLYHDGVCSEASRKLVENHLAVCEKCSEMYQKLQTDEAEESFTEDTLQVFKAHEKGEKTRAFKAGIIIAICLMLPVIVASCLAITGQTDFSNVSVILASMMLIAGCTVIPLISKTKKFSRSVLVSVVSLLLVIFFVDRLFYKGSLLEFGEIACSVIFALSIFLVPPMLKELDLPSVIASQKGLISISWDTIWYYLMLSMFSMDEPNAAPVIMGIGTFGMVLVWAIFLIVRYFKVNHFFKAGAVTAVTGIWLAVGNVNNWVTFMGEDYHVRILLVSLIVTGVLCLCGIVLWYRKNRR